MGMGLPDNRRKADSSYCAKALGAWSWWVSLLKALLLPILLFGNFRPKAMEGALSNAWQDLAAVFGDASFTWTVLFVVCFACVLAFVFEASIEITFPIVALGCLTALTEHVMRDRNAHR
jgi:hypothetical protein